MTGDPSTAVSEALETAISLIYDRVAVSRESFIKEAEAYHFGLQDWEAYQKNAGLKLMDQLADNYIRGCKLKVSGFGAAAGLGGFVTIIPDTLQFVAFTLRMATGIAASYGFDPDPYFMKGKVKVLVLQAYLNANLGQTTQKGIEAVTLSATTRLLRNAAEHSTLMARLIILLARLIGIRLTKQGLLRTIPILSSGANAAFNWYYARQIANAVKAEFRQFRVELRKGKYRTDPAFAGLGN